VACALRLPRESFVQRGLACDGLTLLGRGSET
jgi:hypothetical protein